MTRKRLDRLVGAGVLVFGVFSAVAFIEARWWVFLPLAWAELVLGLFLIWWRP